VLNISRSGFYDWLGRPEPPRELRDKELVKIIREIHAESRGSYGSPRVHAELRLGKDMQVNRKRVERLMREEGLQGIYRRRGRRNLVTAATEEDLVRRQFTAEAPDRLWLTDVTEHPAADGKLPGYAGLGCAAPRASSKCTSSWSLARRRRTVKCGRCAVGSSSNPWSASLPAVGR
jgi:putative transposase